MVEHRHSGDVVATVTFRKRQRQKLGSRPVHALSPGTTSVLLRHRGRVFHFLETTSGHPRVIELGTLVKLGSWRDRCGAHF
jgi:hypothetical protein